jgi:hypothetical protein
MMAKGAFLRHDEYDQRLLDEPGIPLLVERFGERAARTQIDPRHPIAKAILGIRRVAQTVQRVNARGYCLGRALKRLDRRAINVFARAQKGCGEKQ